jgi:hypothetical protein
MRRAQPKDEATSQPVISTPCRLPSVCRRSNVSSDSNSPGCVASTWRPACRRARPVRSVSRPSIDALCCSSTASRARRVPSLTRCNRRQTVVARQPSSWYCRPRRRFMSARVSACAGRLTRGACRTFFGLRPPCRSIVIWMSWVTLPQSPAERGTFVAQLNWVGCGGRRLRQRCQLSSDTREAGGAIVEARQPNSALFNDKCLPRRRQLFGAAACRGTP